MKYVTILSAKTAAKRGLKPALRNTIKRWKQISVMTKKDLRKSGYMIYPGIIAASYCAVCYYYDECWSCALEGKGGCCKGWNSDFYKAFNGGTAKDRKKAANAIVKYIEDVLANLKD